MPKKFKFHYPGENLVHFQCDLQGERCIAMGRNHHQCRNRSVIGVPYCWVHLLSIKHLRIKESTVPNAGKGLFAIDKKEDEGVILFRKGDKIIDYSGERLTAAELTERFGDFTAPYGIELDESEDIYEDAACKRGVGAMANHKGRGFNAEFVSEKLGNNRNHWKVVLVATKIIRNGAEIFVNYGSNYKFNENTKYSTR